MEKVIEIYYSLVNTYLKNFKALTSFDRTNTVETNLLKKLLTKIDIPNNIFNKYNTLERILSNLDKAIKILNENDISKYDKLSSISQMVISDLDEVLTSINLKYDELKNIINNEYERNLDKIILSVKKDPINILTDIIKSDNISYNMVIDIIHELLNESLLKKDLELLLNKVKEKVLKSSQINLKLVRGNFNLLSYPIEFENFFQTFGLKYEHNLKFFKDASKFLKTNILIFNISDKNNIVYDASKLYDMNNDMSHSVELVSIERHKSEIFKSNEIEYINYDNTKEYVIFKILGSNGYILSHFVRKLIMENIKVKVDITNRVTSYNNILEKAIFDNNVHLIEPLIKERKEISLNNVKFKINNEAKDLESAMNSITNIISEEFNLDIYEYIYYYDDLYKKLSYELKSNNLKTAIDNVLNVKRNIFIDIREEIL